MNTMSTTHQQMIKFCKIRITYRNVGGSQNWINLIESFVTLNESMHFEFQLGKRDLYPNIGGSLNQKPTKKTKLE